MRQKTPPTPLPANPGAGLGPRLCEGAAQFECGPGFFNPAARTSRDLGVLLARILARRRPLRVLDLMAGCGLRSLRYALEAKASSILVNDADPSRIPWLRANLAGLEERCLLRVRAQSAKSLLADGLLRGERFDLVDLDAFGSPHTLVSLALEAVALEGVLYLASTDGRGLTGHDRIAGVRHLGAAVRCHPASWEIGLRLQIGHIARLAWCQGRGVQPVFSFSDGRTFRTAVRLCRSPQPDEERELGLLAICHCCGYQQVQPLMELNRWKDCACPSPGIRALAVSGPLWIGALQDTPSLDAMVDDVETHPISLSKRAERLLDRLRKDGGSPAYCWPLSVIARHIGAGPPSLDLLVARLLEEGYQATPSGVMPGQLRSDAPWETILTVASEAAK